MKSNPVTAVKVASNHQYTKPPFSWLEEVPRDPRSLKKFDSKTYTEKIPKKYQKYRKLLPKGTPRGGQKAVNEPTFSSLSQLGPFRGALESTRVAKSEAKGTNSEAKSAKSDPKVSQRVPKGSQLEPKGNQK